MTDLTPEHTLRMADEKLYQEVIASYRYVENAISTADATSPIGVYAWHGWALREAFLAGCTHARTHQTKPITDD